MRSERLPGKVLLTAVGKPLLELMIERLRRVSLADEIVVATTTDPSCDPIVELAERVGVRWYRGSEIDVLRRVLEAARSVDADLIVETTGDCPLIDPRVIDRVIDAYLVSPVDYCSNTLERTFPRGMDAQVFSVDVLQQVAEATSDPVDHEHVSLYIYEHPERFTLRNVASGLSAEESSLRLTVDMPEDLALIRAVFERLYPTRPEFDLGDILNLFSREPSFRSINEGVTQKAVR